MLASQMIVFKNHLFYVFEIIQKKNFSKINLIINLLIQKERIM
jgi:hypothetical protein